MDSLTVNRLDCARVGLDSCRESDDVLLPELDTTIAYATFNGSDFVGQRRLSILNGDVVPAVNVIIATVDCPSE